MYHYIPPVLSSLFRVASYIFLWIIPSRLVLPVLPTLYLFYLLSLHFFTLPSQFPPTPADKKSDGIQPVAQSKSPDTLSTLCFSLQTHNRRLKLTNIFINTLLLAAALDLVLTPFIDAAHDVAYTRVGALYPDSAKIQVRNPANETLVILYREVLPDTPRQRSEWRQGPHVQPRPEYDWVDTVRLPNLWPSTKYEYTIANLSNTTLSFPKAPIPFRTFPDPRLYAGSRFRFIATSCITPNFPYRGPWNKNTIRGFDLLADYLQKPKSISVENALNGTNATLPLSVPEAPPTDFMLFLGDFIYADVPVYVGDRKAAYQRLYRRNYISPSFKRVYEQLPIINIYDDHEFVNNYVGNGEDISPYQNASAAYNIYAGYANYDPVHPGQSFFTFQHGDIAFFVMDTRRFRSFPREPDLSFRTMLGHEQWTALHEWLGAVNGTSSFKFVVSSVPFTSLWAYDGGDTWAAYQLEKASLLEAFHSVSNVVIISGDRHQFAVIEFNHPDAKYGHVVREISTSPLSMFSIPFVRTLRTQSNLTFTRNVTIAENITAMIEVPYEQTIAYIPAGNSKWSTFELDTRNNKKPILRIETVVDGKPVYQLEIIGSPSRPLGTSLGAILSTNIKDLFEKVGLKPGRWF